MRKNVYFSLGSNLGDRERNLKAAVEAMEEAFGTKAERVSSIIETKAEGFDGKDFLNCAVLFRINEKPDEILDICKDIERRMGRTDPPEYDERGERIYKNRIIDIDILLYGRRKISTERLEIPHPRMLERDFVIRPLREIYKGKKI